MIKANELRQGNLLLFKGMTFEVGEISNKHCSHPSELGRYFYEELEPIPLTEDILLKCGFEYKSKSKLGVDSIGEIFIADNGICHISDERDTNYSFMAKCEYLHQLQNLYFALTGEELNVKL